MLDGEIAYKDLLDNMYDGLFFMDRDLVITYWNKGAERISGFLSAEIVGRVTSKEILTQVPHSIDDIFNNHQESIIDLLKNLPQENEVYLNHKEGKRVPVLVRTYPLIDKEGQIVGAALTFVDNSSKATLLKQLEEMKRAAMLDYLTGLPNRRYADLSLSSKLSELKRYHWIFGIIMIDIDYFKHINDTYGHHIGDQVLKMISKILLNNSRPFDIVSRWGGEEFMAIVPHIDAKSLENLSDRFRLLVEENAFLTEAGDIHVTISLGATLAQPDDTVVSLVERADQLLYQSKSNGRNLVSVC